MMQIYMMNSIHILSYGTDPTIFLKILAHFEIVTHLVFQVEDDYELVHKNSSRLSITNDH